MPKAMFWHVNDDLACCSENFEKNILKQSLRRTVGMIKQHNEGHIIQNNLPRESRALEL
jgi:hypothetical protein